MQRKQPHTEQDDHHSLAIEITSGDNYYPAKPLHPYPFTATIIPTPAIWPSWFGQTAQVSYGFVTEPAALTALLAYQPSEIDHVAGLSNVTTHRELIDGAFSSWSSYVNIDFNPSLTDHPQIQLFGYKQPPNTDGSIRVGYSYTTYGFEKFLPRSFIGLNTDFVRSYDNPESSLTILHEIGHAGFGLDHPFETPFFPNPDTRVTSFSIMNYNHEVVDGITIIPITPMPYDIESAQYQYGTAKGMNAGNNVYLLSKLLPKHRYNTKPIASLPWDSAGTDTLSAAGIKGPVTIDLRHYGRSTLPRGYIAMPRMDIEHVIGGKGRNTIILNSLNNHVDIRQAKGTSRIVIDPAQTGHDIILGFNPAKDKLILRTEDGTLPSMQTHGVRSGDHILIGNEIVAYKNGTMILFDQENSVLLANVNPKDILSANIRPSTEEVIQEHETVLLAEFSHYPKEFLYDFNIALAQGSAFTFLTSLTEEGMRALKCTDEQIANVGQLMTGIIAIYTGSILTTSAAFLTSSTMISLGFSNQTANMASTVVATGLNAVQNLSVIGLARMATAMAGGYVGSRFTLWARDKAKQKWQQRQAGLQAMSEKQPHQMV